jgi:hypothetical protein
VSKSNFWYGQSHIRTRREVELVGVAFADLEARSDSMQGFETCRDMFRHECVYSSEKIVRDVPDFRSRIALEDGIVRVLDSMRSVDSIPDSDTQMWEEDLTTNCTVGGA